MSNRKNKRRLDWSNWRVYVTPFVQGGITYLMNERQLISAYGKPQRSSL